MRTMMRMVEIVSVVMMLMTCIAYVRGRDAEEDKVKDEAQRAKVYLDSQDRWIGEQIHESFETLCAEGAQIGKTFVTFKEECEEPLNNLVFHFETQKLMLDKSHFAQVLSRNALVASTARKSILVSEKPPMMRLSESSIAGTELGSMERSLRFAQMRLMNARDRTKELMSSNYFSNETMTRTAELARACADACKRTIESAKELIDAVGQSRRAEMNDQFDKVEMTYVAGPLSPRCKGQDVAFSNMLDALVKEAESKSEKWTKPLRKMTGMWAQSNQINAKDKKANEVILDWTLENPGHADPTTAEDWGHEIDRLESVKNYAEQALAFTQHRVRFAMNQYGPGSDRVLDTTPVERERAILHAEEQVSLSTVAILSAYEHFATVSQVLYGAMLRGASTATPTLTKKLDLAVAAVSNALKQSERALADAAMVGGGWESSYPSTALSVSTARENPIAPDTTHGDATLAVQKARGYADEVAVAARSGSSAGVKHAQEHLSRAKKDLKDKLAAAMKDESESTASAVQTTEAGTQGALEKVSSARESALDAANRKPGAPVVVDAKRGTTSRTPERPLTNGERLQTIGDELVRLMNNDVRRAANEKLLSASRVVQAKQG